MFRGPLSFTISQFVAIMSMVAFESGLVAAAISCFNLFSLKNFINFYVSLVVERDISILKSPPTKISHF